MLIFSPRLATQCGALALSIVKGGLSQHISHIEPWRFNSLGGR